MMLFSNFELENKSKYTEILRPNNNESAVPPTKENYLNSGMESKSSNKEKVSDSTVSRCSI